MGVIGVQENRKTVLLAQALDQGNDLAKAKKLPLAFGYTDHNRNVFVGRAFKDRLECDEVRNIEMTNRNSLVSRLRKDFT